MSESLIRLWAELFLGEKILFSIMLPSIVFGPIVATILKGIEK